jgi:hypothetical protein
LQFSIKPRRRNASEFFGKQFAEDRLQVDRLWLARQRKAIAEDTGATAGERLAALRDLEKSLGWLAPDIITMNHAAAIEHRWTLENIRVPTANPYLFCPPPRPGTARRGFLLPAADRQDRNRARMPPGRNVGTVINCHALSIFDNTWPAGLLVLSAPDHQERQARRKLKTMYLLCICYPHRTMLKQG